MSQQASTNQVELVTALQAAAIRGVHVKTFNSWKIPPVVPGHRGRGGAALFDRADIEELAAVAAERERQRLIAREAELKRNARPEPPEPVDCPVRPGLRERIVAALEKAADDGDPATWLDALSDEWEAQAREIAPTAVGASRDRHMARRECDFHDHRLDHSKPADDPFNRVTILSLDALAQDWDTCDWDAD